MTQSEFHTLVACIAKTSCTWLHEGVVMKLNRNKGDDRISDESVRRFCNEVRQDIDALEAMLNRASHG